MSEFNVSVDISAILEAAEGAITEQVLPTVSQAVRALGAQTQINWIDAVAKSKLWQGEKDEYIKSIKFQMLGDFSAEISSDYRLADEIDNGRPSRDLKKMLDTSLKVRVVSKGKNAGKRYLIIPFRHQTPGNNALGPDMPNAIYMKARQLKPSMVTGSGSRLSGTGAYSLRTKKPISVPQKTYKWGDRLQAGLVGKMAPHHKSDIYEGMVRMKTSAGKSNSSVYLTFRVMMEGSPGWIVPAKPGLKIVDKLTQQLQVDAPMLIGQAFKFAF